MLTDYETAWRSKDAAALAALFAEDGFVLSSGVPPVRGRAQIQRHYDGQGGPLSLRALAYATKGSIGYIIGGFAREKGQPDIGKFTLTLVKGPGGRWLIQSDMDNGNSRGPASSQRALGRRAARWRGGTEPRAASLSSPIEIDSESSTACPTCHQPRGT